MKLPQDQRKALQLLAEGSTVHSVDPEIPKGGSIL
jgi:hypothetical protein